MAAIIKQIQTTPLTKKENHLFIKQAKEQPLKHKPSNLQNKIQIMKTPIKTNRK